MKKSNRNKTKYYHASHAKLHKGDTVCPSDDLSAGKTGSSARTDLKNGLPKVFLNDNPTIHYTLMERNTKRIYLYEVIPTGRTWHASICDEFYTLKPCTVKRMVYSANMKELQNTEIDEGNTWGFNSKKIGGVNRKKSIGPGGRITQ